MATLPCGCAVATDPASGVLRSVAKCRAHRARMRDPRELDAGYYEELGVIRDGRLAPTAHVAELVEALGEFPRSMARHAQLAVEVGCGASPYAGMIREAGWSYLGIDPSEWAAEWTCQNWGVPTIATDWDAFEEWRAFPIDLIFSAHALEHMEDAPGALAKMAAAIVPGGELWAVVPDDSDLENPDHAWYFTEATLRACLEASGLEVAALAVRRHVAHERFIYARARKPG